MEHRSCDSRRKTLGRRGAGYHAGKSNWRKRKKDFGSGAGSRALIGGGAPALRAVARPVPAARRQGAGLALTVGGAGGYASGVSGGLVGKTGCMCQSPCARHVSEGGMNMNRGFSNSGWKVAAVLIVFAVLTIWLANQIARKTAIANVETVFAGAVVGDSQRLESARDAARNGQVDRAVHEYLTAIDEDPSTAAVAIPEMVGALLTAARQCADGNDHVSESRHINVCYQTLARLIQDDSRNRRLSRQAREKLFAETARVRSWGHDRARAHILEADRLRRAAKGFWNDDEDMQAQSLHMVNLAWSYYPHFTTEQWMVSKMYEIWADMKDELSGWQYRQVMERDRLLLGRVIEAPGRQ